MGDGEHRRSGEFGSAAAMKNATAGGDVCLRMGAILHTLGARLHCKD